ncbi:hypothetical protein [Maricaulis sp.]|uniref:hypothetical protein n=1 Tax=Maricaulis sp. TaxID=1486257 RepID=UPI003A8DC012
MTYRYAYDAGINAFRIRFEGAVDMEEILRSDRDIIHEPEWAGSRRILTLLDRDADLSALTIRQYLDVAMPYMDATRDVRGDGTREAWVIPARWNSPIIHVWEQLPHKDEHHAFAVFETEPEALDWLLQSAPGGG